MPSTMLKTKIGSPQEGDITPAGPHIMIGFQGQHYQEDTVQHVLSWAKKGLIGGVIFFRHNFSNPWQAKDLVACFQDAALDEPLFLAIDQEGGSGDFGEKGVQRLWSGNGFRDYPTAFNVAKNISPQDAYDLYAAMAHDVATTGLNLVFGPVVDLHHDLGPVGQSQRSYSPDPETVETYAQAYIKAFKEQGLITCLKHFPGHGFAQKDSHQGWVDITKTYHPHELMPFTRMIEKGYDHMVMTAHVFHQEWDPVYPATLSKTVLSHIPCTFDGLVVSDDLMMGAIQDHFSLQHAVDQALSAGVDITILSCHPGAYQSTKKTLFKPLRLVLKDDARGLKKREKISQFKKKWLLKHDDV